MVSNVVLPSGGELARIYPSIILNGDNVVCKKYNMDNDDLVWFESVDFDDSDLNKLKSRIGGDWVGRNGSIGKFEMDVWHLMYCGIIMGTLSIVVLMKDLTRFLHSYRRNPITRRW
jgi:hypothetical protein